MPLEADQLKIGHLTYQAATERIQFNLEVVDRSGSVAKESVLAMLSSTNAAPVTAPTPQPAREANTPAKPQAAPNVQVTAVTPPPSVVAEAPQPAQAKARAFSPPVAQRTTELRAILDAPPALPNGQAASPVGLSGSLPALSPPPVQNGVQRQVQVSSSVQAANLIKKVVPAYPSIAKTARIHGVVRFTALIGKDGRIQNLQVLSGPSPLVDAATAAVRQWVYRPTMLNNEPVEVVTQIDVNFTLDR